ncbi:hypothetical protein AJ79_09596 [Helicocarpus griseus UAMH5409]|uniref:Uncharacterized protein n=1 Tax=Helicocarpus griseus UAMH5409 TaxID=1447875 RepID=A0A2B7WIR1_9EURO|nr:hypothetical protein AJ79_09596 [Helicocarpus griseus UAMH5409]
MAASFPSLTLKWHTEKYDSISPSCPELSTEGKTVLVTSGGTGIGVEIVLTLPKQARLTLPYSVGGSSHFSTWKLLSSKSTLALTSSRLLQMLIRRANNAALACPIEGVGDVNTEAFMTAINVNISGALYIA